MDSNSEVYIYALCEPGTRTVRYIGKSNNPDYRLKRHLDGSIKQNTYLGRWMRSLGGVAPNMVILSKVPESEWEEEEKRYIRAARALGLRITNGTDGGEGCHNPTAETRANMSASHTGEKHPAFGKKLSPERCQKMSEGQLRSYAEGRVSGMKGKHHTEETKAVLRESQKGEKGFWFGKKLYPGMIDGAIKANTGNKYCLGRKASDEARANMSAAQLGRKQSPEHIKNASEARRGLKRTAEARAKISAAKMGEKNPNFGKTPSPETRAKISDALVGNTNCLGHKASDETRAKISAAVSGEKNPFFGKTHSPEARAKMSATKRAAGLARKKAEATTPAATT